MPSFFHFRRALRARDEHRCDEAGDDDAVRCGMVDEKPRERRRSWGLPVFKRRSERKRQKSPPPSPSAPVASPTVLSNLRRRLSGKHPKNNARHKRSSSTSRLPSNSQTNTPSLTFLSPSPISPSERMPRHVRSFSAPMTSGSGHLDSEFEAQRRSAEEQAEIESLQEFANSIRELMGEFRRATAAMQEDEARRAAMSPAPPTVREDDTPLSPIAEDGEDDTFGDDDDDDLFTNSTSSSSASPATPTGFTDMDKSTVARLPYIPEDDEYEVDDDEHRAVAQLITFGVTRNEIKKEAKDLALTPSATDDNVNIDDMDERKQMDDTGTTLVPELLPSSCNNNDDYLLDSHGFCNPLPSPANSTDAETESESELDTDTDVPASFVSADDGIDDGVWSEGSQSSFGVLLDDTTLTCTRLKSSSEPDLAFHPLPPPLSEEATPTAERLHLSDMHQHHPFDHERTPLIQIQIPFPNFGQRDSSLPSYAETTGSKSSSQNSHHTYFTAPSTHQSSPVSYYYTPPLWTPSNAPLLSPFIGPQSRSNSNNHSHNRNHAQGQGPKSESARERHISSPGSVSTVLSYFPPIMTSMSTSALEGREDATASITASNTRRRVRSHWSDDSVFGHGYRASIASQIQNQLEELSTSLREAKLRARSSSNLLAMSSDAASASFLSLESAASCEAERDRNEDRLGTEEDAEAHSERSMLRRRNAELERELERVNEELRQLKAKHEILLRTIDFAWEVGHDEGQDPELVDEQQDEFGKLKLHVDELQATIERLTEKTAATPSSQEHEHSLSPDQCEDAESSALPRPPAHLHRDLNNHTPFQRRAISTPSSPLWTPPQTPHASHKLLNKTDGISVGGVGNDAGVANSSNAEFGASCGNGHERSGSLQERAGRRKYGHYGVARRRAGSLDSVRRDRQRGCAVC